VIAEKVASISKTQAQAELFNKQAASTEATAMYDLAMAKNLLLKHQGDMVAALNEAKKSGMEAAIAAHRTEAEVGHLSAKTDKERAQADQIRAKTPIDRAQAYADVANTHADTVGKYADVRNTHADTAHSHAKATREHIGSLIDALTPIPESETAAAGV